jgi:hypothetical protein
MRAAHRLATAKGDESGHAGRKTTKRGHSLPGDHAWDKSGYGKKVTEKRVSLPGDRRERHKLDHTKKATERGVLTSWRAEGGISQDMERKWL